MRRILLLAFLMMATALAASAARGDVNGDGEVNIADVNAVLDLILKA